MDRDPHAPSTVAASLEARVQRRPQGRLSVIDGKGAARSETYGRLWERAAEIAAGLQSRGVSPGAAIVLLIADEIEFVPAFWACLRAGWTAAPLSSLAAEAYRTGRDEPLREAMERLPSATVVVDDIYSGLDALRDIEPARLLCLRGLEPGETFRDALFCADPVCIIATSGSTGRVKLAAISPDCLLHRSFAPHHEAILDYGPSLAVFPVDCTTGLNELLVVGSDWIQLSLPILAARPLAAFDAIERFKVARFSATNSMIAHLIAAAEKTERHWDLGSLKSVGVGAEPVMSSTVAQFDRLLQRHNARPGILRAGYGSTETGTLVTGANPLASPEEHGAVELGGCARGVSIRIVDDNNEVLNDGEIGEIQVFCPQKIFSEYVGEAAETSAAFTSDMWWRSGDLGRLHAGSLYITGRAKDVLLIFGKKYSLAEIENEAAAALHAGELPIACAVRKPGEATEWLALAVVADPAGSERISRIVRAVIGRRFGLQVRMVVPIRTDEVPLTRTGKVDRNALARRFIDPSGGMPEDQPRQPPPRRSGRDVAEQLRRIWDDILTPSNGDGDFFERGGDSLHSITLFMTIEEEFGTRVDPQDFFLEPTFETLARLVHGPGRDPLQTDTVVSQPVRWPLPPELRRNLHMHLEAWEGARPTRDRLVVARNSAGPLPPLFWVFQDGRELARLADRLGPRQPLYGFRSGHLLINYAEDDIQMLALRYTHEIEEACPAGTVFLGGNCQGAIIALAVAQHLLRRGRHVASLILMEWGFPLLPYSGPVLLVHGRDSLPGNPFKRFRHPHHGWDRVFAEYEIAEIEGSHGQFFEDINIGSLAMVLTSHLATMHSKPPRLIPRSARHASIAVRDMPVRLAASAVHTLEVMVRNTSPITWGATDRSGLSVGNYWIDASGTTHALDGRSALPDLAPGQAAFVSLTVLAPACVGLARLIIDVVEDGSAWFDLSLRNALDTSVTIE